MLFISAIAYTLIIKLIDWYIVFTSYLNGVIGFWIYPAIGRLSPSDIIALTGIFWWLVAGLDLTTKPKSKTAWMAFIYCMLLAAYTIFFGLVPQGLIQPYHQ